jgi:TonB family protein
LLLENIEGEMDVNKLWIYGRVALLLAIAAISLQAQETTKERVINGGVLNGKATSLPKPEYPAHLRQQGKGGIVNVDVTIDESGTVISAIAREDIKVTATDAGMSAMRESIDPALIEAAENAARTAQFSPTLLSGVPVKIKGTITYNFTAGNENVGADNDPSKGNILNGRAVSLPLPVFPPAAKAVRAEGTVSVLVQIDEAGNVVDAQAVSGHPLLRAAAVEAAKGAKFRSTTMDGEPAKVSGVLVYNFVGPDKND